jgi:hypothetical protein
MITKAKNDAPILSGVPKAPLVIGSKAFGLMFGIAKAPRSPTTIYRTKDIVVDP